ncbi:MAG TPA: ParA family protein [Blastocatellia bacterium]|jgi:chromosome partitioning protein|nr:ParA family protein [Blastocatellia bacterium]
MSKQIAIAASKGGTGKTTTTWNLGFGLALAGARVLLIDGDPQDNLRLIAGFDQSPATLASVLEGGPVEPLEMREGMWLLPSGGRRLASALSSPDNLRAITNPLRRVISSWAFENADFVLFDCPPEFGRMTQAALSVSDYLLVPCISTWLGLRSIEQMIQFVDSHSREARIDNDRIGIVMTFYTTRRAGPEAVRQEAKKIFRTRLLRSFIRERTELDYSQEAHKSVFEYAPHSDGAQDYTALVKEAIKRVG